MKGRRTKQMKRKAMSPEKAEQVMLERGIGKRTKLRIARIRAGLSQSELSRKAHISVKTLQHYEQGTSKIDGAKLETLCNLSAALDVSIADILESKELKEKFNEVK